MITIHSFKLNGIDAVPVNVEVEIKPGIGIHLVGLADTAVKESLLRTVTALQYQGYRIPGKKIVINLAPADLHKSGSGYDLPIALGFLAASGQVELPDAGDYLIAGELGLDGSVRDIPGAVNAACLAKGMDGLKGCILPRESAKYAASIMEGDITIYGVDSLDEALEILKGNEPSITALDEWADEAQEHLADDLPDWDLLSSQPTVCRALEIAAAGGHGMLLVGEPGTNKAIAAKVLSQLLPPMTWEESCEVAKVYSVVNKTKWPLGVRPFRHPHYSASLPAIMGGGIEQVPGEVSLAHNGVLYLGEWNMFPAAMREAICAALEDKKVSISRLKTKVEYPSDFIPVLSVDTYGDDKSRTEKCLKSISGPVLDHIGMHVYVNGAVNKTKGGQEPFSKVRARIDKAREAQMIRQLALNDSLSRGALDVVAVLDDVCKDTVEALVVKLGLSARAYTQMLKIARTIADLAGSEDIKPEHLTEAASYRFLDRQNAK